MFCKQFFGTRVVSLIFFLGSAAMAFSQSSIHTIDEPITFRDGYETMVKIWIPTDPINHPSEGWPAMLVIHGHGGSRNQGSEFHEVYAERGYIVVSYDVRGQGDAISRFTDNPLNNPCNAIHGGASKAGASAKMDMAEVLHFAKFTLGKAMDFSRLGVRGKAQGGIHAFSAAVWSGREMPTPFHSLYSSTLITHFPTISAAASAAGSVDSRVNIALDGNAFRQRGLRSFFEELHGSCANLPYIHESILLNDVVNYFYEQDYEKMLGIWDKDPWRANDVELISTSNVPVMAMFSYEDFWTDANGNVDIINSMARGIDPGSPERLLFLATGFHGSWPNNMEASTWYELQLRWFDHFLQGVPDDIVDQPMFWLSRIPDDLTDKRDPTYSRSLVQIEAFPAHGLGSPVRHYLRSNLNGESWMARTAPTGFEKPELIEHKLLNPSTFNPITYSVKLGESEITRARFTEWVRAEIPASEAVYRSSRLKKDTELLGRPSAHILIQSQAPNLQVAAAIYDEDLSGNLNYVTSGFGSKRERKINWKNDSVDAFDFDLGDIDYVFRRDHRVVLKIGNHAWHHPDSPPTGVPGIGNAFILRTVPFFEDYSFEVMHSIGRESWINLPIAASPVFSIRANRANIPYVNKRDFEIQLDATEVGAGQQYQVLVSASGWDKVGHFFGSGPAKVNLDSSDPIYNNFLGNTDLIGALDSETGRATVTFTLNTDPAEPGYLDPSVIGKRLSFIAVKNNGTSQSDVSGITQVLVTGD